ncbi:MAG: 50S ribosomal protein L11 methyltransferase [Clostridia bacterium]|nr:50S ribosomal protein L11 methyltransferase [Clostridia bacterium]
MHWIEAVIHTTAEGADIVSNLLCEAGAAGTEIVDRAEVRAMPQDQGMWDLIDERVIQSMPEDVLVKAYFAQNAAAPEALSFVRERLHALRATDIGLPLGSLALEQSTVHEEDWAEHWKRYYKPFRAGDRLVVKPSWEAYDPRPGDLVIEMDPGMAFGTGTHETTAMCLRMLERCVQPGCACLDVGCGTGILAIACALLGASKVTAVDIDPTAVTVAERNVRANGVAGTVRVRQGDLLKESPAGEAAGVLVANIIADVIRALASPARAHIAPGGVMICSGIIREREQDVLESLCAAGYTIAERFEQGEWVCLAAKRAY